MDSHLDSGLDLKEREKLRLQLGGMAVMAVIFLVRFLSLIRN